MPALRNSKRKSLLGSEEKRGLSVTWMLSKMRFAAFVAKEGSPWMPVTATMNSRASYRISARRRSPALTCKGAGSPAENGEVSKRDVRRRGLDELVLGLLHHRVDRIVVPIERRARHLRTGAQARDADIGNVRRLHLGNHRVAYRHARLGLVHRVSPIRLRAAIRRVRNAGSCRARYRPRFCQNAPHLAKYSIPHASRPTSPRRPPRGSPAAPIRAREPSPLPRRACPRA